MQETRVELEQKLRDERDAAAAATLMQTELLRDAAQLQSNIAAAAAEHAAALTSEILLCRDREKIASQEAEKAALETRDTLLRAQAVRTELRRLESMTCERELQEGRLALELDQLRRQSQELLLERESQMCVESVAAAASSGAVLSTLPHELLTRVDAALDTVSREWNVACDVSAACAARHPLILPPLSAAAPTSRLRR
jgi:hypothetical protein